MGKPSWYIQPRSDDTDAAWRTWQSLLSRLAAVVAQSGAQAWLVGGILRDTLSVAFAPQAPSPRRRPVRAIVWRDVDIAVTGDPLTLARALAADVRAERGNSQGVAIAPLRAKTVRLSIGPPILPFQAQLDLSRLEGATIEADLAQRDFRVNALALPLAAFLPTQPAPPAPSSPRTPDSPTPPGATPAAPPVAVAPGGDASALWSAARLFPLSPLGLIDPFGGEDDLFFRRLNVVGPHALTDDPGRILRAARLLVTAALTPTVETTRLAREAAPLLLTLPADRIRDELRGIMAQSRPQGSLEFLAAVGAFQTLLPALWASLTDAPPREAPGGAWWLALSALAHASSPSIFFGAQVNVETGRLIGAEAQLLDGWYAQPLADGAPRSLALRWGLLLAAPVWRELAGAAVTTIPPAETVASTPATTPTPRGMETLPAPRAAELAGLARTLPITREQRHIAATIALATPAAYALLASLAARGDEAAPDGTLHDEPPLGVIRDDEIILGVTHGDETTLNAIETRRYFAAYGAIGVDALAATLCLVRVFAQRSEDGALTIGHTALDEPTITRMGRRALRLSAVYLTTPERIVPAHLIDGATLIRGLGVAPGPLVGATLAAIRTAQIEGQVTNRADALAWGAAYLRRHENRVVNPSQMSDEGKPIP